MKLDDLHEAGKSAAYNPEYGFSDLSPFHVSTIFLTLVSNNSNKEDKKSYIMSAIVDEEYDIII